MLEYADMVVLNKFDRKGAQDALYAVRKQYQRNFKRFAEPLEAMPVYPTLASNFNDPGVNRFFKALMERVRTLQPELWAAAEAIPNDQRPLSTSQIIPPPASATSLKSPTPSAVTTHGLTNRPKSLTSSRPYSPWKNFRRSSAKRLAAPTRKPSPQKSKPSWKNGKKPSPVIRPPTMNTRPRPHHPCRNPHRKPLPQSNP